MYWKIQQWFDKRRKLTLSQGEMLTGYYNKALGVFQVLGIDIQSMPEDKQHLYHMMLVYADREEVIMPASARTSTMINFLNRRQHNWVLPAAVTPLDAAWADQIDGYVAVELMNSELKEIYDEICTKIDRTAGKPRHDRE